MRLTKYFPESESIDKDINAWVKAAEQQRHIIQIEHYKNGIIVLFEKFLPRNEELAEIERSFEKPVKKAIKKVKPKGEILK